MRYLLTILFSLTLLNSYSQPLIQRTGPANTVGDYNLFALRSFRVPVFLDTTAANLVTSLDSCGKQIYTYTGNKVWVRGCSPKRWIEITTGGGTTPTWQQTLIAGSTLSQNNSIIGGGYKFDWSGLDSLNLIGNSREDGTVLSLDSVLYMKRGKGGEYTRSIINTNLGGQLWVYGGSDQSGIILSPNIGNLNTGNVRVGSFSAGYPALNYYSGGNSELARIGIGTNELYINGISDSTSIKFKAKSPAAVLIDSSRFSEAYGSNVSSANNLILPYNGNTFNVTGSTQINAITTYAWQSGSIIRLKFAEVLTVKDNTSGGAGTAPIQLSGNQDYTTVAGDILQLQYDGSEWSEIGRFISSVPGGGGGNQDLQSVTDNGDTTTNSIQFGTRRTITGTILTDNFTGGGFGSANYDSSFSTVSRTFNGQYLEVNSGNGTFANYVNYNKWTGRNQWQQSVKFVPTNLSNTTYGIALGIESFNGYFASGFRIQFICNSGSDKGQIRIWSDGGALIQTSTDAIAFNTGDTLIGTVNYLSGVVSCVFENKTQNDVATFVYDYGTTTAGTYQPPNTGKFTMYFLGGTQRVFNYTINSNEAYNNVVFIGNSITYGYAAAYPYRTLIFPGRYAYEVSGGPGDRSADVVLKLNEIGQLYPKYAIYNIGVNDVISGVTSVAFGSNMRQVADSMASRGIRTIFVSGCPVTANSIVPYNDSLQAIATRYGFQYINTFDSLKGSGTGWNAAYLAGDGVHPNQLGHAVIARIIKNQAPQINGDTILYANRPMYGDNVQYYLGLNPLNGQLQLSQPQSTDLSGYVQLNPSASQTGAALDLTGLGTTVDTILVLRSGGQYAAMIIDNFSNRQSALWFNRNGVNRWQFGTDFAGAGTNDFYIYDNASTRNPLYITSGGDMRLGGTSGFSGTQAMTITQTGNVGIGIASPANNLSIRVNTTAVGGASGTGIEVEQQGTGDASINFLISGVRRWLAGIDNSDGDKFKITTANSGDFESTGLVIQTDGNVGIGNSAPASRIHIGTAGTSSGTIAITGSTSGTITMQPQAAAGTYNWNWPTTAGNANEAIISQGGGSTAMTWKAINNGTYTPTLSNSSNISASTAYTFHWIRMGDEVSFSGQLDLDPTIAGAISIEISLPIASDFTLSDDLSACATNATAGEGGGIVSASGANNTMSFSAIAVGVANITYKVSGHYQIK